MKKKNKEQKPSGKYPALYYQETWDSIVIIYPNGAAEYRGKDTYLKFYESEVIPPLWCDALAEKNFHSQIKVMHQFDVDVGLPPAIYLGEIK